MNCPACPSVELGNGPCQVCGGIWLDEAAVRARTATELDVGGKYPSKRACPVCDRQLHSTLVFDIEVDRCTEHGMWFDKTEIEKVIERSKSDEWRLYSTSMHSNDHASPLTLFLDAIDAWRMRRKKSD